MLLLSRMTQALLKDRQRRGSDRGREKKEGGRERRKEGEEHGMRDASGLHLQPEVSSACTDAETEAWKGLSHTTSQKQS